MMFTTKNQVRMHDTDMAGILYFPKQFRFVHDAWEDLMEQEGLFFHHLFTEETFAFVVVHAEADYLAPLQVGNKLEIQLAALCMGTTSFTLGYKIFKLGGQSLLVGTAKTVHVVLDRITRKKISIPDSLRQKLNQYSEPHFF